MGGGPANCPTVSFKCIYRSLNLAILQKRFSFWINARKYGLKPGCCRKQGKREGDVREAIFSDVSPLFLFFNNPAPPPHQKGQRFDPKNSSVVRIRVLDRLKLCQPSAVVTFPQKHKLSEKMTPLLKKDSSIGRRFNLISKRTISQSIVCIFSLENQQKRKCGRCPLLHPNHSNGKYQFAT